MINTDTLRARESRARQIFWFLVVGGVLAIIVVWMVVMPRYRVWSKDMWGRAALAEAVHTKRIRIESARGEMEAAKLIAQGELDASRLRVQAIAIMGKAAKEYPEYRAQEYLKSMGEALSNGDVQKVIYVPTEAQLPILEAGLR